MFWRSVKWFAEDPPARGLINALLSWPPRLLRCHSQGFRGVFVSAGSRPLCLGYGTRSIVSSLPLRVSHPADKRPGTAMEDDKEDNDAEEGGGEDPMRRLTQEDSEPEQSVSPDVLTVEGARWTVLSDLEDPSSQHPNYSSSSRGSHEAMARLSDLAPADWVSLLRTLSQENDVAVELRELYHAGSTLQAFKEALQKMPLGTVTVLAGVAASQSFRRIVPDSQIYRAHIVDQFLQRKVLLRPRQAARMLAMLADSDKSPEVLLEVAVEALRTGTGALSPGEALAALEGICGLRSCNAALGQGVVRYMTEAAAALAPALRSVELLPFDQANRALVMLALAPEAAGSQRLDDLLHALKRSLFRWKAPSRSGVNAFVDRRSSFHGGDTLAAAACSLARFGAWVPKRCEWLLREAMMHAPSPCAGSFWLAALAQSGSAEFDNASPEGAALLDRIELLKYSEFGTPDDVVRAVWALSALGILGERDLGSALVERLREEDPGAFTADSWALLHEISMAVPEGLSTEPFESESWKRGIAAVESRERRYTEARNLDKELRSSVPEGTDTELWAAVGGYSMALYCPEVGIAFDIDSHGSPVNRVVRRAQWKELAPDIKVMEISAASWDFRDDAAKASLVQELLEAEEARVVADSPAQLLLSGLYGPHGGGQFMRVDGSGEGEEEPERGHSILHLDPIQYRVEMPAEEKGKSAEESNLLDEEPTEDHFKEPVEDDPGEEQTAQEPVEDDPGEEKPAE